jgi:hypothetical protein
MPSIDDDPFCEQALWAVLLNSNSTLPVKNPVAAATGVLMVPLAFVPTGKGPPLFMLCKAALCITGVGTAIYHSISPEQADATGINHRLCDWLSMTLMCANVILLYLSNLLARAGEAVTTAAFFAAYLWMCFIITENDFMTYGHHGSIMGASGGRENFDTFMSLVLMAPMGVIMGYCLVFRFRAADTVYLWIALVLSMGCWVSNAYLCEEHLWTSMLHACFHLLAGFLFLHAACLGVALDEGWEFACAFLPRISRKEPTKMRSCWSMRLGRHAYKSIGV